MLTDSAVLPTADARAVLAQSRLSPLAHAGVSLLLLAGLRPMEVQELRIPDYLPGPEPRLQTGTVRHPRTIQIAPTTARALDAYLVTQDVDEEDFLLPELRTTRLVQLVRGVADAAGVAAGVHDLRKAAVAEVLEDGTPVRHLEAYFGVGSGVLRGKELVPLPEGYDAAIATVLERAFVMP